MAMFLCFTAIARKILSRIGGTGEVLFEFGAIADFEGRRAQASRKAAPKNWGGLVTVLGQWILD